MQLQKCDHFIYFIDKLSTVQLYTAWFSPFAQRARISLLAKGVNFDLKEIDPYDKTPEFLAVNPRGLVPTIVHNGKCIYESTVCIEYVDDAFPGNIALLPSDPFERAQVRIWSDFVSKKIVPLFYRILMQPEKLQENSGELLKNLAEFSKAVSEEGPFFTGKSFGMVDIMLVPHTLRFYVLKHYRGFEIPETAEYIKLRRWMEACHTHASVVQTMADSDKLLEKYKGYADNTAKTGLADAIRKGTTIP